MKARHKVHHPVHHGGKIESETELAKKIFSWALQAKLTFFLILVNFVIFLLSQYVWPKEFFNSLMFTANSILALNFTQMIASWFLHANWLHLGGNLLFLFIFGRVVERRFGSFKTSLIYFGAAVVSDIISGLAFSQGGIGASGAIAGLIAAAVIVDPFYLTYFVFGLPVPILIVGWVAIFSDIFGVLQPVQDNIGHTAHLAGFFGITLLIFLLNREDQKIKLGFFINLLTALAGLFVSYMFPGFKIFGK